MDWAIILSMPLMLLLGFLGDALSRDEDEEQGMGQANGGEAALAGAEPGGDLAAAGDGLSAMMAASQEDVPQEDMPGEAASEEAREEAVGVAAGQNPQDAPAAEPETADAKAEAEEEAAPEQAPAGDDRVEDEPADAPADRHDAAQFEDFDPQEDVLLVEAPGASEEAPELEQTEHGTFVRLAGQETFLRGVADLPVDAVVGIEPSLSA